VSAGQVLVELEAAEARADAAGFAANLVSARAEMARRRAALAAGVDPLGQRSGAMATAAIREGASALPAAARPAIAFPPDTPPDIKTREETVLAADLNGLTASLASLEAQRRQKQVERQRLAEVASAQQALVETLKERVDMRASLLKTDSGNKASVIDAREQQQYHQTVLVERRGQLLEAEAAAEVLARELDKTKMTFLAENSQKLSEAERTAEDLEQKLARAQARLSHMTIKAPIAGTVQALAVNSPGQVITTGQEIMRLIPADAALEIEAYLLNKDIGFVSPGQDATIKIESFPFTRYGTIDAKVTKVARDAIPEPDARQIEGDPARPSETKTFAGAQRTQNLVFPVTLTPARTTIEADGALVPLQPGMAVSVEVKTGSRRIIDYVFSPLVEVTSEAGRER
jgi:hemolysin D